MADITEDSGTLETVQDAGKPPPGTVKRWLLELALADKEEKLWRESAERIEKRYRGDGRAPMREGSTRNQFNILWSNTETLSPALYNSTPTPDVRRRFRDKDPIGKAAAELLERSLDYAIDAYDFDDIMQDAIHDTLIVGRAVARVRYLPSFKTETQSMEDGSDDDGSYEALETEQVLCELVPWADFRHGPGKRWRDVSWIAFKSHLTREELTEKFGEIGKTIELADVEMGDEHKDVDDVERDVFKRLPVWEIWDKDKREVVFIAETYKDKPLKVEPDPMGLDGFFPIPRPMYSIRSTKNLVPIPEYTLYEDQARELDRLSARIAKLIEAIKFRGIYDSTIGELKNLLGDDETVFRPAQNVTALIERGGLEKAIWTMPIETAANVLAALYQSRNETKQTIYEITGISDILRGSTDPNETATAQGIKNQWGALRLQRRQAEVQRFARDVLRLKAEIIAEKFQPETVLGMANLKFPTQQEKQAAQQQQMMAEQARMQPPPGTMSPPGQDPAIPSSPMPPPPPPAPDPAMLEMLDKPSVEEVFSFLRDNAHRQFRIDIETDSTIAAIIQQDQKNITELLSGMTAFMQGVAPAVQAGALPMGAAKAIMLAAVRRFKMGSEVEDELDKIPEQLPPQPGKDDGEAEKMKAEMDAERAGMAAEMKGKEIEFQTKEGEIKMKELGMKIQEKAMALDVKEKEMGIREQELGLRDQISGHKEGQIAQRETGVSETEAGVTELQESVTAQVQEIVDQAQQDMARQMQEFMAQIAQMQAADSAKTHADMLQVITGMVGAMTAPKRIIRDQAGRAAGVETVQ